MLITSRRNFAIKGVSVIGKTVVIGIGYKARRGKDTAAKPLVKGFPSLCAPLCLR
jgi:hypothetical protein